MSSPKLDLVLLIDDDRADNYLHQMVLERAGVAERIEVAHAADEALGVLEQGELCPDMILLDINMPRMNGFEFLEELDAQGIRERIHAIVSMLTTSLNPSDRERSEAMRVDGFVSKPLDQQGVLEIVGRHFPDRG